MNSQAGSPTRMLMWLACIGVIVFCVAGVAAIMGWIPTSIGRGSDAPVMSDAGKATANATKAHARLAPAVPVSGNSVVAQSTVCLACGVVESTRAVSHKGEGSGIGAVGGAVVGGLLGTQIGSGRGNTAATAIGAVGGAMVGNEAEKRVKSNTVYEVTVRLEDGSSRVISEANPPQWRNGDHVKIVNGAIQSNS